MAFLDDLQLKQSGSQPSSSTYFGDPGRSSMSPSDAANALMPFFHQVRNRDIEDFKAKASFANNLQLKQPQLQKTFNPSGGGNLGTAAPQDVIYQPGPSDILRAQAAAPINPLDQAKLALEKDKLSSDKLDKSTDNALNEKKFGLDQQKNEQIHQNKEDDLQRKSDDANNRLKLAYDQLTAKGQNAQTQLELHQAQMAAKQAADDLKDQQHKAELDETRRIHDAQIADMQAKMDALQNSTSVTELNPEGTKRTTTTTKGSPKKRVAVIGPKGEKGTIEEGDTLPSGWKAK